MAAIRRNEDREGDHEDAGDNRHRVGDELAESLRRAAPNAPRPEDQSHEAYAPEVSKLELSMLEGGTEIQDRLTKIVEEVTQTALKHITARRAQLDELERVVLASGANAKTSLERHLGVATGLLTTTTNMGPELENYRRQIEASLPNGG